MKRKTNRRSVLEKKDTRVAIGKKAYAVLIGVLTMCVSSEKIDSEIFLLSSGGRLGFFLLWLLFLLGLLGLFLLLVVLGRSRGSSRCTD